MAWLVRYTTDPRYAPLISLPDENEPYFDAHYRRTRNQAVLVEPSAAPRRAIYTSAGKTIPDFVPISAMFSVCQEIRDHIEALEPGVHQFLPVEVVRPRSKRPIHRLDGRVLDAPYYIVNIMSVLDPIWVERSSVRVVDVGRPPPLVHLESVGREKGNKQIFAAVLKKEVIDGHHLWRGGFQCNKKIFFSDALMEEVHKRRWKALDT